MLNLFPEDWEQLAESTEAMTLKLRNFDSAKAMIRLFLLHIAHVYSLRETVARAKAAGLATISDVALLKRLCCSGEWLNILCCALLHESDFKLQSALC